MPRYKEQKLKNQVNCHVYPSVNTVFSSAVLQFYLLERIRLSYLKLSCAAATSLHFKPYTSAT